MDRSFFRQGSKSDAYLIKEGEVEVSTFDPKTGKKVVLNVFGPESVIGTLAFLMGLERTATAICLSEVKCVVIKEQQRDILLKQVPPWLKGMIKDMSEIIKSQNEKYVKAQSLITKQENIIKKLQNKVGEDYQPTINADGVSEKQKAPQKKAS